MSFQTSPPPVPDQILVRGNSVNITPRLAQCQIEAGLANPPLTWANVGGHGKLPSFLRLVAHRRTTCGWRREVSRCPQGGCGRLPRETSVRRPSAPRHLQVRDSDRPPGRQRAPTPRPRPSPAESKPTPRARPPSPGRSRPTPRVAGDHRSPAVPRAGQMRPMGAQTRDAPAEWPGRPRGVAH